MVISQMTISPQTIRQGEQITVRQVPFSQADPVVAGTVLESGTVLCRSLIMCSLLGLKVTTQRVMPRMRLVTQARVIGSPAASQAL